MEDLLLKVSLSLSFATFRVLEVLNGVMAFTANV